MKQLISIICVPIENKSVEYVNYSIKNIAKKQKVFNQKVVVFYRKL